MTVTYDFTGKAAFVTGGSAGMGEATVRAVAEAGAAVAIVDRDAEAAQRLTTELTEHAPRSFNSRARLATLRPASRCANIHRTCGAVRSPTRRPALHAP